MNEQTPGEVEALMASVASRYSVLGPSISTGDIERARAHDAKDAERERAAVDRDREANYHAKTSRQFSDLLDAREVELISAQAELAALRASHERLVAALQDIVVNGTGSQACKKIARAALADAAKEA